MSDGAAFSMDFRGAGNLAALKSRIQSCSNVADFTFPEMQELEEYSSGDQGGIVSVNGPLGQNRVLIPSERNCTHPIKINFHTGRRNLIVIGPGAEIFGNINIHGDDNVVVFSGATRQWSMVNLRMWGTREKFFWGRGSTSNGCDVTMQGEDKSVIIADDCMFANAISIRNSDMHPMVDLISGEWINPPGNIEIGRHVWVCQDVLVLKNTKIGAGAIIGAKSVVNKDVASFSLVAGAPARTVRTGVSWDRPEKPRAEVIEQLAQEYRAGTLE